MSFPAQRKPGAPGHLVVTIEIGRPSSQEVMHRGDRAQEPDAGAPVQYHSRDRD